MTSCVLFHFWSKKPLVSPGHQRTIHSAAFPLILSTANVHFMVLQSPHPCSGVFPSFPHSSVDFPNLNSEVSASGTKESKNKSATDLAKTIEGITYYFASISNKWIATCLIPFYFEYPAFLCLAGQYTVICPIQFPHINYNHMLTNNIM